MFNLIFSLFGVWYLAVYACKKYKSFSFFENAQDWLLTKIFHAFHANVQPLSTDSYFLIECQNSLKEMLGSEWGSMETFVNLGGNIIWFDVYSSVPAVWVNCHSISDENKRILFEDVFKGILKRYLQYHNLKPDVCVHWEKNRYGMDILILQYAESEEETKILTDLIEKEIKEIVKPDIIDEDLEVDLWESNEMNTDK